MSCYYSSEINITDYIPVCNDQRLIVVQQRSRKAYGPTRSKRSLLHRQYSLRVKLPPAYLNPQLVRQMIDREYHFGNASSRKPCRHSIYKRYADERKE